MQSVEDQDFEAMAVPHLNALFQTALQLTETCDGAEDVVHEAYTCAWKSFEPHAESTDWRLRLFKILIQRIHRRNRSWFGIQPAKRNHASEEYAGAPCDPDMFLYLPEQVASALSRVPPAFREIILLVDCQEFSYKDAAHILDLSTGAVAEGLVLGRKHLRLELATAHSPELNYENVVAAALQESCVLGE